MARSVTYSVVPRINPREKDEAPKYYAQAQARGDVNIREMSERIQAACTVNKADVYAVLVALPTSAITTTSPATGWFMPVARCIKWGRMPPATMRTVSASATKEVSTSADGLSIPAHRSRWRLCGNFWKD